MLRPCILTVFTNGFHTTSVVCHSCIAAISKNRLSRYYTDAQGLLRPTRGLGPEEGAALFKSVLCREKAGKRRAFEELLKAIFKQAKAINLLDTCPQGAIDATGLWFRSNYVSWPLGRCRRNTKDKYFRQQHWFNEAYTPPRDSSRPAKNWRPGSRGTDATELLSSDENFVRISHVERGIPAFLVSVGLKLIVFCSRLCYPLGVDYLADHWP